MPDKRDNLLELGPGLGALTDNIFKRVNCLAAVELDPRLVVFLKDKYSEFDLRVKQDDILKIDLSCFGTRLRLVGNLPYHISSPILFHVNSFFDLIQDAHFMLQKEVVERMVASPGSKAYGRLSVMLQYRWKMDSLFDVSPNCFSPAPKVWSSLVRMIPIKNRHIKAKNYEHYKLVVARAFSQRRKMLRNSLKDIVNADTFCTVGIDSKLRAENLSVENFINLANESFK